MVQDDADLEVNHVGWRRPLIVRVYAIEDKVKVVLTLLENPDCFPRRAADSG